MLSRQLNVLYWMWIWFSGRLIKQYTCTRTRKHTYIFRSDTNKSLYSFYTFRAELYVKTLLCPLLPFSITIKYFLKELKCFFYFTLKSKRYNCTNCKKKNHTNYVIVIVNINVSRWNMYNGLFWPKHDNPNLSGYYIYLRLFYSGRVVWYQKLFFKLLL